MTYFQKIYTEELERAVRERPLEYTWPIENAPAVAEKMTLAFQRGGANKDGIAVRRTCKRLGIKYTYAAIEAAARGEV